MRQAYTGLSSSTEAGQNSQAPFTELPLDLTDHSGHKRRGRVVLMPAWPPGPDGERPADGEDFRIVIVSEPPEALGSPPEGVVVSAPARPLASGATGVCEAGAKHGTAQRSRLVLSPKDLDLLRQGRLFASTPLQMTADDVFSGGKARLALLARDLLASVAMTEYQEAIAMALSAPAAAKPACEERLADLKELIGAVATSLPAQTTEAEEAVRRLSELTLAPDRKQFLTRAEQSYPGMQPLMEDIYALRCFRESPDLAEELVAMRRFLRQAVVPPEDSDLAMDRSLIMEQLTFAVLATAPERLTPARAMLETFRRNYVLQYREHHTQYWCQMARLHARLREEQTLVDALQRLNTVAELGPPVGIGAIAAYEELVAETAGCPIISSAGQMPENEGACPACGISLENTPPSQRVEELITRIERACQRQMARLSASAVQQVLRGCNDARVDGFLKVVQASQLSSLPEILDDKLVGYIRRFLVEFRVREALQPILDRLETGASPEVEEARSAMREVSAVLERSFQVAPKALPPGNRRETRENRRRRGKRVG